jgi:hypothetical protein
MKAFGRPLLLALAMAAAALIPLPAEAATEHPVRTTPAGEFQPARGPNHLAWEQNTKGQPNHFDVFMQPDGGEPVRVNAGRSNAAMGGIDDDLLVFQQYRKKKSDLFTYDLNTGTRSKLPKKINSRQWEYWPSVSEPWLLFGRWKPRSDRRFLILHNLESGERRVLNKIRGANAFIGPGQVNGDYAVWWRCPNKGRCQVHRYQISTGAKTKLPNPGKYQRAPSVNAEGTVFLARGAKGCGGQVQIVKIAPDGTETVLTKFPPALDSRDTYAYTDERGITHVYYERFGCGRKTGSDIYEVMDPELTGSITVIKDAVPDAAVAFEFAPSANLQQSNFFLDDDGAGSNQRTFTGLAAGTYTVQEVNVPSEWQVVDLECVGDTDGDTTTGMALASINLDPGEDIVCTFTNARSGSITIVKDSVLDHPQNFEFDPSSNLQTTNFFLNDDGVGPNLVTFQNLNVPGTYTVRELATPAGWELTDLDCAGGGANTIESLGSATATIGLDAGEAVVCTFENTGSGSITVVKDAVPDSAQSFGFSTTGGLSPSTFTLDDDGVGSNQQPFTGLLAGTYTVTEDADPLGWQLTDITCEGGGSNTSDADRTATIGLEPGENVECTYTNTVLP